MDNKIKRVLSILLLLFIVVVLIQLIFFSSNLNKPNIANHSDIIQINDSDK